MMTESAEYIRHLLIKYLNAELSDHELAEFEEWKNGSYRNKELVNIIDSADDVAERLAAFYSYDNDRIADILEAQFSAISLKQPGNVPFSKRAHRIHFLKTAWFRYAAAVLIILGISVFTFLNINNKSGLVQTPKVNTEILQPGADKAILTLSDGRQVVLNDSSNQLIEDGKISINKNNGILTYKTALTSTSEALAKEVFNTMNIPRGRSVPACLT